MAKDNTVYEIQGYAHQCGSNGDWIRNLFISFHYIIGRKSFGWNIGI